MDFEGPWMAMATSGEIYEFEVEDSSVEIVETEAKWGKSKQYKANMRNINDSDGDEQYDDGEYLVPFWACRSFKLAAKEAKVKKGWFGLAYIRDETEKDGKPFNTASIKAV